MRCARRVIWTGLFSRISGKVYLSRPLYYRVFTSFRPLRSQVMGNDIPSLPRRPASGRSASMR